MAFKQGKKPAVRVAKRDHKKLRGALLSAGYEFHTGLRTERDDEIQAWVKLIGNGRQVHVQETRGRGNTIKLHAHTEPEGETLEHLWAALTDQVSFQGGSRVLKNDLRAQGWDV